jgi:Tol biopolymer transport system component
MITFSRNGTNIWVMDADGGNQTRLTSNRLSKFNPMFSPNGMRITFNKEDRNERFGVWAMRADGSNLRQLTFGRFDFFPDWQPVF